MSCITVRAKVDFDTFRDSVLNFSAFLNNVMVIDAFFFFNERFSISILIVAGGMRLISTDRNFGDEIPLEERESYADNGTYRNQNLHSEIC